MKIDKEKLLGNLKNIVSEYRKEMSKFHADTDVYNGYESAADELEHLARVIESGTFDIKEKQYKCPNCNVSNSDEQWNLATMHKYGNFITVLQAGVDACFICPSCGCEIDGVHIKEESLI